MKKHDIGNILFYILSPILLGTFVGMVFNDNSYLESLNRSIEVPPVVFPIVWSILYILIGIWYSIYQKEASGSKKVIYYVLLIINLLFSPTLFYLKNITLSLIIVIILIIGNIYLLLDSIKGGKKFGYLLAPYVLWLFVAFTLMMDLFINNIIR